MSVAYSEACERNKGPILDVLRQVLPARGNLLEIGSCTGQHVLFFAPEFPAVTWQPSDRTEYLEGLKNGLDNERQANILPAIELDVLKVWPDRQYEMAYSANTAHIMSWEAVCAMFEGLGARLVGDGLFCLYGPFNRNGEFTSESNEAFDRQLRSRDPQMGIRDIPDLASLAERHHMKLERADALPANNQLLTFRKNHDPVTETDDRE